MDIKKTVQAAINFERRGVNFYLELASQTKNRLGRRLFYSLAGEEISHILTIEDMAQQLEERKIISSESSGEKLEGKIRNYFQSLAREKLIENRMDNLEGYEMAMQIENQGYEMYKNFQAEAGSEYEKNFFTRMMEEERKHYEALQNVYYYLKSPDDWFSESESRVWNWMV